MKFYILFVVILIIPYSMALAQNSDNKASVFLSDQGGSGCINCGKKIYNSGSGASASRPFSIRRMIESNQSARQMKSADIIRRAERFNQTGQMQEIFTYYNKDSGKNDRKLYELALETQNREAQKVANMSAERQKRAELIRARVRQQQEGMRRSEAQFSRMAEQRRQLPDASGVTRAGNRNLGLNRSAPANARSQEQQQPQRKQVYRGGSDNQDRRKKTGTRVFLSPR